MASPESVHFTCPHIELAKNACPPIYQTKLTCDQVKSYPSDDNTKVSLQSICPPENFPTLSSFQIHVMPFTLSQTQAHLLVIHMFFKSQIVYGIPFARLAIRNLEQRNRSKQNIYVYISTCCFAT
jgi:hypothetical protein